ncbi:MAG: hypothetical protein J2P17_30690 [Mycobacterium sp.]|nr:hypothetical protein [Mycobacterium sp.]
MFDQSTGSIVTSSNLFSMIEMDMTPTAASTALITSDDSTFSPESKTLTVAEARETILSPDTPDLQRDAIWSVLIRRVKATQSRHWQRIAIWTMLPYLRGITYRLHRTWGTDLEDLRSEVVLGFLEALRQADPGQQHLGRHLWWNTYRIARRMCRQPAFELAMADDDLIGARAATDRETPPPIDPDLIAKGNRDSQTVEGERLGSLAARLGLRAVIADHVSGAGASKVIFLPKSRGSKVPNMANARGNGSGEAA